MLSLKMKRSLESNYLLLFSRHLATEIKRASIPPPPPPPDNFVRYSRFASFGFFTALLGFVIFSPRNNYDQLQASEPTQK